MGIIDKIDKRFSLRDAALGVNMNDMEQAVHNALATPFPPALKSNVLAWWDAGYQKDVVLGLNQLVANGNYQDATTSLLPATSILSSDNNILSSIGTGAGMFPQFNQITQKECVPAEKIYVGCRFRVTNSVCQRVDVTLRGTTVAGTVTIAVQLTPEENTWYTISEIVQVSATATGTLKINFAATYADAATASGKVLQVDGITGTKMFDATSIFGLGNEPTATEFSNILSQDGNQYWEGTRQVKVNPSGKYYAYDASGNGRHAKLYNMAYSAASGPQAGPPKHWKGDGVDDWMGRAEAGFIAEDADFSCFSCFRPPTDGGTTWLNMGQSTAFDTGEILRMYYQAGEFWARLYDRVTGYQTLDVAATVVASAFYTFGISYTQSDKKFKIYASGALIGESNALANGHSAIKFVRNFRNAGGTLYTSQSIGTEGWFNKALTLTEWKSVHNKLATRFGLTPVA